MSSCLCFSLRSCLLVLEWYCFAIAWRFQLLRFFLFCSRILLLCYSCVYLFLPLFNIFADFFFFFLIFFHIHFPVLWACIFLGLLFLLVLSHTWTFWTKTFLRTFFLGHSFISWFTDFVIRILFLILFRGDTILFYFLPFLLQNVEMRKPWLIEKLFIITFL